MDGDHGRRTHEERGQHNRLPGTEEARNDDIYHEDTRLPERDHRGGYPEDRGLGLTSSRVETRPEIQDFNRLVYNWKISFSGKSGVSAEDFLILEFPSFKDIVANPFHLQTDASNTGLGVVLTQVQDGEERVISFASRTLLSAERNYSVIERECLAVVSGIRKFREYIEGFFFKVITDHSSLKWLRSLRNPTGRLARWSLELLEYDFEIIHRKGALHHVPDALSKITEDEEMPISSACDTSDSW